MHKGNSKFGEEPWVSHDGLANSPRPLPIARSQSDTSLAVAPSWAEMECSAQQHAPQYAPHLEPNSSPLPPVLVNYSVQDLRPLPSYVRHKLSPQVSKLAALANLGGRAFRSPLFVTHHGFIVDGYETWEMAKTREVSLLQCLEYELDERQALEWFIDINRRSERLPDFTRIELALDLEDHFRGVASLNRQLGGRIKGSSTLTGAEKVDSRREIARVAGVSVGNVHKVKFILNHACSPLVEAVRTREVSINQAEKWSHQTGARQLESLRLWRVERGLKKRARHLVSGTQVSWPKTDGQAFSLEVFVAMLQRLTTIGESKSAIEIRVVHRSGRTIFVTDELIQSVQLAQGVIAHEWAASD